MRAKKTDQQADWEIERERSTESKKIVRSKTESDMKISMLYRSIDREVGPKDNAGCYATKKEKGNFLHEI